MEKHRESAKGIEKGTGKGTGRELGKRWGTGKTQDFAHAEEKEVEKHSIFNHRPGKGTGKTWKNTAFSITTGKGNWKHIAFSITPKKKIGKTQHFQSHPGKGIGKTRQLQARPGWELEKHSMWEDPRNTAS